MKSKDFSKNDWQEEEGELSEEEKSEIICKDKFSK